MVEVLSAAVNLNLNQGSLITPRPTDVPQTLLAPAVITTQSPSPRDPLPPPPGVVHALVLGVAYAAGAFALGRARHG
jgi:hypothetical protein